MFLTHAAAALAGSGFALSLSYAWVSTDGRNHENNVMSQKIVIAMLATRVMIVTFLQVRALPRETSRPRTPPRPTPIGDRMGYAQRAQLATVRAVSSREGPGRMERSDGSWRA